MEMVNRVWQRTGMMRRVTRLRYPYGMAKSDRNIQKRVKTGPRLKVRQHKLEYGYTVCQTAGVSDRIR